MTTRSISRRNFLKAGCLTGTAAGLALCGGGIALHPPVLPPIELASYTYREKTAGERLLVVYASFAGSTIEVAAAIGQTLAGRGFSVDVRPYIHPTVETSFAGKFGRRGAVVLLPGLLSRQVPPLDFRDWGRIRAWSQSVSI